VKDDPEKFIKKLEDKGVTLYKVQTICPVMGGKINKKLFADHDGKRVYFCCAMCTKKFKEDPEKYIKKLETAGVAVEHLHGAEHKKEQHHDKGHDQKKCTTMRVFGNEEV